MPLSCQDEDLPPIPDSIRAGADDSNAIIEVSARLCYMSFGRGRRDISDFIHNLLSSKDGSVFEHVNYGFVFTGVSRSLTHELVRHRAGFAYSQRSQRYVDETEGSFVLPPALTSEDGDADEAQGILKDAMESASESYVQAGRRAGVRAPQGPIRAQHRPPQGHPSGGTRSAAQRHRDQDIRHRQRQSLAAFHRDAPPRRSPTGRYARLPSRSSTSFSESRRSCFGDFEVSDLPDGTQIAVPEYSKV